MFLRLKRVFFKLRSMFLLRKVTASPMPDKAPIGFSIVKDEINLIEKILQHYRGIGCKSFVILDNGSTDGTFEFLKQQQDVTLYTTSEKYKSLPGGLSSKQRWATILLNRYGAGKWCVGFDADELFIYPNYESRTLVDVIEYMENHKFNALKCQWIDFYSSLPVSDTSFEGQTLLESCHFFDNDCLERSAVERVFGWRSEFDKTPLFKWSNDISIDNGWHRIGGKVNYADFKGASLHFPFNQKLFNKAKELAESGQYYNGSAKYKQFYKLFQTHPNLNLYHEDSVKFENSGQLYREGYLPLSAKAKVALLEKTH